MDKIMRVERQSNIELLRIFAIMGVIVLHYCNPVVGGGITYAIEGGVNFYLQYFLVSVFACAVNLFIVISGYFMCKTNRRSLWRPIELIVQVIIYSLAVYFLKIIISGTVLSVNGLLRSLIPSNYFIILYCSLYIISPLINKLILSITQVAFKRILFVLFIIFSIYPTLVDLLSEITGNQIIGLSSVGMYGSQWGYSIVNFILMYFVGAYIRLGDSKLLKYTKKRLAVYLALCILIVLVWARINDKIGFFTERSAWEYCNPFIIIEAVIIFMIFSKINLGTKKYINKLAEGAISVFLLHNIFIGLLHIEKVVVGNTLLMIAHILVSVAAIYIVCFLIHLIYSFIFDKFFRYLSKKIHLPSIYIND